MCHANPLPSALMRALGLTKTVWKVVSQLICCAMQPSSTMPFRAATITRPAAAACWSTSRRANRPRIPHIVRASADPLNDGAYCDLPLYAEAPDMDKRRLMNALVLGAVALPTAQATYTYLSVLMPAK